MHSPRVNTARACRGAAPTHQRRVVPRYIRTQSHTNIHTGGLENSTKRQEGSRSESKEEESWKERGGGGGG